MSEEKTKQTAKKDEPKTPAQQAVEDTQSPDEKHEAYLKTLERLHDEP